MADNIRATPRNELLGLLSDAMYGGLDYMKDPRRTQQLQGLAGLLESTGIPKTTQRMAYGEPLTNIGSANVPLLKPETAEAMMTVAPMVGPAARTVQRAAMSAGRAGERLAERVVPQVMERGGMGAGLLGDLSRGSVSPLDVYHGTPHTLPPTPRNPLGEFDASKIGTGEGNQAYGYGIYTAEAPAVANEYKLAEATYKKMQGGLTNKQEFVSDMLSQGRPEMSILDLYAQKYGGSFDDAMKDLIDVKEIYKKSGNLYKVDLPDEKIAKMLDWDKPMSEQQMIEIYDKMQQSPLASFAKPFQDNFYESMNRGQTTTDGQDLYIELLKQLGGQKQVSDFLRSIDIPGIKYLDQGSRGTGKGTRNFVTFPGEEKSMTILERNGMRGLLGK